MTQQPSRPAGPAPGLAPHAPADPPTFPVADLERRFMALALDRATSWTLYAVVGVVGWLVWGRDGLWLTLGLVLGLALLVVLVNGVVTGTSGATPGKRATSLRVVHHGTGLPIGAGPGILRSLVLGLSALPTFGFGLAALAWTALADPRGQRRGWHDQLAGSVVVDLRPEDAGVEEADQGPRHVVNLTAMRLVPAAAQPPPVVERPARPAAQPGVGGAPAAPSYANAAGPPPGVGSYAPPAGPPPGVGSYAPPAGPAPVAPSPAAPPAAPSWAPPGGAPRQPAPAAASTPAPPATPGPPAASPTPTPGRAPSSTPPAADPGRTVARRPATPAAPTGPRWRVAFDTGEAFVVEGLALVGRRPEPRAGEQVRHLVPLTSTDMSLSKTHAQFGPAPDGSLVVMDRGSTNGSLVLRQGVARELHAGKPTTLLPGDRVRFGDREMSVEREA
ncbi:RDD family protein [Nocardioides solisilvae]|uniref:RDD family protein n=1 Tax=Nocardioides solisilvae TaxID=1542435 RepID=UPI000D747F58|nr:RDD family protein [Nocardioides solisilvae]